MLHYTAERLPLRDIEPKIYRKPGKKGNFLDNIIALDIEDTSYFVSPEGEVTQFDPVRPKLTEDYEKGAICYHWQLTIDGNEFTGRELESLQLLLHDMHEWCGHAKKIIYAHHLAHEFGFLRNILEPSKVFARKAHLPMYFDYEKDFQFRCSYHLTHLSLDSWGKSIGIPKLKGALNYHKLRTPFTELEPLERWYCMEDIRVMLYGLRRFLKKYGHIADIPLTQTSELRYALEPKMQNSTWLWHCTKLIPQNIRDHLWMVDAFFGGTVIASSLYRERLITELMWMFDLSSSYPWVLLSERYPLSPFVEIKDPALIRKYMQHDDYTFIVEMRCTDVQAVTGCLSISGSKVRRAKNLRVSNGRVVSADYFEVTLTRPDFELWKKTYKATSQIIKIKFSKLGYLPDTFRLYILELYENKTKYKDVPGYEDIYATSKKLINAMFGLCVYRAFSDEVKYIGDEIEEVNGNLYKTWIPVPMDASRYYEKLKRMCCRYSLHKNYLALQFGIFVTAYARRNLWAGVLQEDPVTGEITNDQYTVYCDTDSVKAIDHPGLREWFKQYNVGVLQRHQLIAAQLGVDPAMLSPKDPKGIEHPIGVFACENPRDANGEYMPIREFKTLGTKRYCYRDPKDGELHLTVAGVNKRAVKCLDNDINNFRKDFSFSELALRKAGAEKLTPYYLDNIKPITFPDGYRQHYHYGIHLMETTYELDTGIEELIQATIEHAYHTPACFEDERQGVLL